MGRKSNKLEDIWSLIEVKGADECWPWLGRRTPNGYAIISVKRQYQVSRVVCWMRNPEEISLLAGKNRKDMQIVLHSCDNPGCCNPGHLSVGTPKQNTQDMIAKGRRGKMRGETAGRAKLSHEDVKRIREASLFGAMHLDLAQIYGVSGPTISQVVNRKVYRCVP